MRKIYLSRENRKIAGVFGGLGETFDIDPTVLRLLWIFTALVTGFFAATIVYLIAWWVLLEKPTHKIKDEDFCYTRANGVLSYST